MKSVSKKLPIIILLLILGGSGIIIVSYYSLSSQHYQLRSKAIYRLSEKKVFDFIKSYNFFDYYKNPQGQGIQHRYQQQKQDRVIYDAATNLSWQQSGSNARLKFTDIKSYIHKLNSEKFAGFNDWRLPSLEEAMSLLEPTKNDSNLHINSRFDPKQWWIWTSDQINAVQVWVVYYFDGNSFSYVNLNGSTFVRAVRSNKTR